MCRYGVCTLFAAVITSSLASQAARAEDDLKGAQEKVSDYLKNINGQERARVIPVKDESVAKVFPKYSFVAVLYPQFPVGRLAPEPLKVANVMAVPAGEAKIQPLSDVKQLEGFFKKESTPRKGVNDTDTLKAWLRLSAELAQDGFYKFKEPEALGGTASSDGRAELEGKITVDPAGGNKGEITATISFNKGAIQKIEHKVNLSPGPRPRCQATKLLDPDPIIRQMAEDSIRVMGNACKYYLDEQRAKASPDLQKAIDRVWQRILDEGR